MNIIDLENLLIYCQILNVDNLAKIIELYKVNKQGCEDLNATMRRLAIAKASKR